MSRYTLHQVTEAFANEDLTFVIDNGRYCTGDGVRRVQFETLVEAMNWLECYSEPLSVEEHNLISRLNTLF